MEVWKDINGFEGIYQVSDLGRIKSLEKNIPHWRGGESVIKEFYKKSFKSRSGYLIVPLTKNGNEYKFLIHRIVAEAFIENPLNKPQVNHKNGIKTDNRAKNLEWNTHSENIRHADDNGLRNLKGINNSQSKLTETQVLEIRSIGRSKTLVEIADMYGIRFQSVSKIINRKNWKHI